MRRRSTGLKMFAPAGCAERSRGVCVAKTRQKESDEVLLARIKQVQFTIRLVACLIAVVAISGIIAWAAVRINDKPAWATVAGAIIAAMATPSGVTLITYFMLRRSSAASPVRDGGVLPGIDSPPTRDNNEPGEATSGGSPR